jgi:hypothetical protein
VREGWHLDPGLSGTIRQSSLAIADSEGGCLPQVVSVTVPQVVSVTVWNAKSKGRAPKQ